MLSPINSVFFSPESISRISLPLVGAQLPFSMRAIFRPWRLWLAISWSRFSMVTNTPAL